MAIEQRLAKLEAQQNTGGNPKADAAFAHLAALLDKVAEEKAKGGAEAAAWSAYRAARDGSAE